MTSSSDYLKNYNQLIQLFQKNLSTYPKIMEICTYFLSHPDLIHDYITELDKAIFTYNYFEKIVEDKENMYINTSYFKEINPKFILPDSCGVFEDMFALKEQKIFITDFFNEYKMMNQSDFFRTMDVQLLKGILFVGAYRTYLRVRNPWIIKENIQVASVIEEMLACMALHGEKTKLFQTIKSWILLFQIEGFSEDLASKVTEL